MNRLLLLLALAFVGTRNLHADPAAGAPKAPADALAIPVDAGNQALANPVAGGAIAVPGAQILNGGFPETPLNIRLELQVVAIPEQLTVALVDEMKNKEKIEAAYIRIQDMLAKGTAKLIGWPIVITKSGQRSVIESIHEIRYATEYNPPTVHVATDVPADSTVKVEPKADVTTLAGIPTAFETRNAGVTFEVEPVLGPDGKTIDLNMVPQDVRLKGFEKVTIEGAPGKSKVVVEQPRFDTMKVTTSITILSGRRMLLGVFRTDDPAKHFEFFILKVETVPAD